MRLTNSQLETLQNLGLSKNQVTLYLKVLETGLMTALELSRTTGINRQQVYEEAEGLVKLGLFDITRKTRKKFIAARPDKLLKIGEEKVTRTQNVLSSVIQLVPDLENLANNKKSKVVTKYYEGMERIKEVYMEELAVAKNMEVLSFAGSLDDLFKFFPEKFWDKWNKQFVKQRSESRMLVHYSKVAQNTLKCDKAYNRQTRYLDKFPLKASIDIFGDTTLVVSFYDEMAVWVESRVLADSYKILFETLWALAKKFS